MVIPANISHGLVPHWLSAHAPSKVKPILGVNMRQVVSPSVPTIVHKGSGSVFLPLLTTGLLAITSTITICYSSCNMPRRNYHHKPPTSPHPAAHPLIQQRATCQRKRRFATERMALDAAQTQSLISGQELTIYTCQWCRGWHLSSRAPQPTHWRT